jgi:hypothetical protein
VAAFILSDNNKNKQYNNKTLYSSEMFLPENVMGPGAHLAEKQRKEAFKKIEEWSMNIIPAPLRSDVNVSVQEVQCGDPQCSPIDTAISVVFNRYVEAHVAYVPHQVRPLLLPAEKR